MRAISPLTRGFRGSGRRRPGLFVGKAFLLGEPGLFGEAGLLGFARIFGFAGGFRGGGVLQQRARRSQTLLLGQASYFCLTRSFGATLQFGLAGGLGGDGICLGFLVGEAFLLGEAPFLFLYGFQRFSGFVGAMSRLGGGSFGAGAFIRQTLLFGEVHGRKRHGCNFHGRRRNRVGAAPLDCFRKLALRNHGHAAAVEHEHADAICGGLRRHTGFIVEEFHLDGNGPASLADHDGIRAGTISRASFCFRSMITGMMRTVGPLLPS